MRLFKQSWSKWALLISAPMAMSLWYCEPGKSLNPSGPPGPGIPEIPVISAVRSDSALLPTEISTVQVTVRDTLGQPLGNQPVLITSLVFNVLKDTAATTRPAFSLDSVPANGQFSFIVAPRTNTYTTGIVTISVGSGTSRRRLDLTFTATEAPVPPFVSEQIPTSITVVDSPVVVLTITGDSAAGAKLTNAVVDISSSFFTIHNTVSPALVSKDTTGTDGRISFRINSRVAGTGILNVNITTAAGIVRNIPYSISVTDQILQNRTRLMTFTVMRPILKADGSDSTELRVVVKDENSNPLSGERITFRSTGGLVSAEATTDVWGRATGMLISERSNKTVVITATLVKTGATAQQTVVFDGIGIKIEASKKVIMRDSIVNLVFELTDANGVPMSGDTLEIVAVNAYRGIGRRLLTSPVRDSMLVAVDTRGQYRTHVTSQVAGLVILEARALGARKLDTIIFNNNSLTITSNPAAIIGNGSSLATVTAMLEDSARNPLNGYEMRWTTTFGSFTTTPFGLTVNGRDTKILRAPNGSGLATINVEAIDRSTGRIVASGGMTVRVLPIAVDRLSLRISPDNIPVRLGEARLEAQAFDSADNVMTGVLIGFRLIKGAGGGDEVISPPVDYTTAGFASSTFRAGGVISLFQTVKISAVALDIVGTDTLIIAASDTVGLTISGPASKVSVGANILKGINPNDGTFLLPSAAVVTDVNGNLVADNTPVNFGVQPVAALYKKIRYRSDFYGFAMRETVWVELPWTDYNNNGKLDQNEPASDYNRNNPARGEDKDGDGVIYQGPEGYVDVNQNGVWDAVGAEPAFSYSYSDTVGYLTRFDTLKNAQGVPYLDTAGRPILDTVRTPILNSYSRTWYEDLYDNNVQDVMEPFHRRFGTKDSLITDLNKAGQATCKCTGQFDSTGRLYEQSYFGSPLNRPYPGYASIGIDRQKGTISGKATTFVLYVQSDALRVKARVSAESNGIRNTVDVILPIILGE